MKNIHTPNIMKRDNSKDSIKKNKDHLLSKGNYSERHSNINFGFTKNNNPVGKDRNNFS